MLIPQKGKGNKNAMLLGGPRHRSIVPVQWSCFECCIPDDPDYNRIRSLTEIMAESFTFTKHVYLWEYRGNTIFGVYKPFRKEDGGVK